MRDTFSKWYIPKNKVNLRWQILILELMFAKKQSAHHQRIINACMVFLFYFLDFFFFLFIQFPFKVDKFAAFQTFHINKKLKVTLNFSFFVIDNNKTIRFFYFSHLYEWISYHIDWHVDVILLNLIQDWLHALIITIFTL